MHAALATPTDSPPSPPSQPELDVVVEALRAAAGWRAATAAGNAVRLAKGLPEISIRQTQRELRKAGRLEKFPHPARTWHRPRKPALTEAECKLAVEARPGAPGGKSWDDTVDLVNAGRDPKDRISERLLRERLLELGLWRPGQWR